jgi:hypothetical protein
MHCHEFLGFFNVLGGGGGGVGLKQLHDRWVPQEWTESLLVSSIHKFKEILETLVAEKNLKKNSSSSLSLRGFFYFLKIFH